MSFLSTEFAERRVKKRYLALVSGTLPETETGRIETPLLKTGRAVQPGELDQGADEAVTDWQVLKRNSNMALVEARPLTGRMHQIRAHLAHLGCPILGDPIYGAVEFKAERLMLHAAGLEIGLPSGETLSLEAPAPADFTSAEAKALN